MSTAHQMVVGGSVGSAIRRGRDAAMICHEVELQRTLEALFQGGGYTAVHLAVGDALKRLGERHRAEIAAQGWVV